MTNTAHSLPVLWGLEVPYMTMENYPLSTTETAPSHSHMNTSSISPILTPTTAAQPGYPQCPLPITSTSTLNLASTSSAFYQYQVWPSNSESLSLQQSSASPSPSTHSSYLTLTGNNQSVEDLSPRLPFEFSQTGAILNADNRAHLTQLCRRAILSKSTSYPESESEQRLCLQLNLLRTEDGGMTTLATSSREESQDRPVSLNQKNDTEEIGTRESYHGPDPLVIPSANTETSDAIEDQPLVIRRAADAALSCRIRVQRNPRVRLRRAKQARRRADTLLEMSPDLLASKSAAGTEMQVDG